MNRLKLLLPLLAVISLLTGCSGSDEIKTYVYEKDGFGGNFTIQINPDGTFSYYEGFLSSYIGCGNWESDGNTITLKDEIKEYPYSVNRFEIDNDDLIFISEDSDNFTYIKVTDGERFSLSSDAFVSLKESEEK